jgi:hypothetical protein
MVRIGCVDGWVRAKCSQFPAVVKRRGTGTSRQLVVALISRPDAATDLIFAAVDATS